MTITAPTLDTITGNTVMVKMRELIKQMTAFAKEVADLVNTIPTDIQDTYSREEVDDMIDELDTAISTLSDSVYPKSEVYTKNDVYTKTETDALVNPKANAEDVYTKSEVYTKNETDALVNPKANANNVYTKSEVYTKTETDTLIFPKANSSDVYNKAEINNLLSEKQNELTAGTGISIVNDEISATGNYPHWELVPADKWATYLESDATYAAKEDVKIVYYLNDGYVRGEYEVLAGTRYTQSAGLLYTVGTQNNMLRIQTWSIGNFPGETNPVTSTTVRYRIYTYLSDGTSSNEMRTASKTPSATSSNYIALYHKVQ